MLVMMNDGEHVARVVVDDAEVDRVPKLPEESLAHSVLHLRKGQRFTGDSFEAGLHGIEEASSIAGARLFVDLGCVQDVELGFEPSSVRRFIPW